VFSLGLLVDSRQGMKNHDIQRFAKKAKRLGDSMYEFGCALVFLGAVMLIGGLAVLLLLV
jgi:hypothetical protein